MRKSLLISMLSILLIGCAIQPAVNWNNADDISSRITVTRDDYTKVTTYEGPLYVPRDFDYVFLRATKPRDSEIAIYLIYVKDYYLWGWRSYNRAYDSDGKSLNFKSLGRDVDCGGSTCSYEEHVGLLIDREYLENHRESGLRFKIIGSGGEEVFYLPPTYVQAFLHTVK